MKKNYTFFFMHRYLFDAYWCLPIINHLYHINLFFFIKMILKILKFLPKKNIKFTIYLIKI